MNELMAEYMTARQLQELLQVDRTTIYRMAERRQVPALKVGGQWRFPRQSIDAWLSEKTSQFGSGQLGSGQFGSSQFGSAQPMAGDSEIRKFVDAAGADQANTPVDPRAALPLACVQLMQDTFAHVLGVQLTLIDMTRQPITQPSNPCGLYCALAQNPLARNRYWAGYRDLAQQPGLHARFSSDDLGLLYAKGVVWVGGEMAALVIASGVVPTTWPPAPAPLAQMARQLGIDPTRLVSHVQEAFYLDEAQTRKVLDSIQRIADIIAHIMEERSRFQSTLQNIAELTRI